MSATRQAMQAVDGVIIPRSTGKTLGWIFLAIVSVPFGCLLVWGKIRNVIFGEFPGGNEVTLYGLLLGIVIVVAAPIMVYQLSRSLLVRRRLVIGHDRLQIQERQGGIFVAVLQIPFANIASVQYEITKTDRQVSINLNNPDDPETAGEGNDFRANANIHGRNYFITEAFRDSPDVISAEIQRAMKLWAVDVGGKPLSAS